MHTISSLRKTLDLATTHQVRNRIGAIKDVLADHLRRGPNNQILITDEGATLLRQLQELYDSGLTMTEASAVLRAKTSTQAIPRAVALSGFVSRDTKPSETSPAANGLRQEIEFLRERVAYLETRLQSPAPAMQRERPTWWERLREDVDAA
jgi:hypothetical protein